MTIFLHGKTSSLTRMLDRKLRGLGLYNVFNPSFVEADGAMFAAFRAARNPTDRPFRSFLCVIKTDGTESDAPFDFSRAFAHLNLPAVSDPKLFRLGNEVWVTVNTGHFESPNRIFVMPLHPDWGEPRECYFAERGAIEKNWGFFLVGDELYCLYMLNPLTLLRCIDRHAERWEFVPHPEWRSAKNHGVPLLTIGPQPIVVETRGGLRMRVVAHQKFTILRKRVYLGRAVEIALDDAPRIISTGPLLAHSFRSMLGSQIKHNKNLISCTYFSGIQFLGDRALLGYGINDVNFSFAEVAVDSIL